MAPEKGPFARASFATLTILAAASVAVFVLVVLGLTQYERTTAAELATWQIRLDDIAELGRLVGEVDGPGNEVFDTGDQNAEQAQLRAAEAAYRARSGAFRSHVAVYPQLVSALEELDALVEETIQEAEAVFVDFAAGRTEAATRHMSVMDRRYARARAALLGLRTEVVKIIHARHADQANTFRSASIGTLVGGLGCLGLMAAAFVRGRRLAREQARARATLAKNEAAMKRILDAVGEGLILVDDEGRISAARSAAFERIFGPQTPGKKLWEVLGGPAGEWAEISWPTVFDGSLPLALALDQLPKKHRTKDAIVSLAYENPATDDGETSVLVVARDVTEEEEARDATAEAADVVAALYVGVKDPLGTETFMEEGRQLLASLPDVADGDSATAMALHTMKGSASLLAIDGLARLVHDLESKIEEGETPSLAPLRERFAAIDAHVEPLLRTVSFQGSRVSATELANLVFTASTEGVPTKILAALSALVHPRISTQLEAFAERGRALARRLELHNVRFEVEDSELRVPLDTLRPFLATLVHVVRNALDHALEDAEARRAAGKPEDMTITLRAFGTDGRLTIEIRDDGRGIDLDALARAAGIARDEVRPELVFEPKLTTKSEVTSVSGRGVGLAAVREACDAAGGRATVTTSAAGVGFQFWFSTIRV